MQKKNTFYAMLARMKYIKRWALMRNAEEENISEHSLEEPFFLTLWLSLATPV